MLDQTSFQNDANTDTSRTESIYQDITQTIGNTPLVSLSRLAQAYQCHAEIVAKVEFFNPAGSIKDRPAYAMLQALMNDETFNKNTQIIEASSGNNGVACAWLCAMYDIPLTIVIPEHMSIERQKLIKHYGANVITTPKALGTKGAIDKAQSLVENTPGAVSLDQFGNRANPLAHIDSTASEIMRDTCGNLDAVVAGVGTGGTITGLAQGLRHHIPELHVIAVEPARCPVLSQGKSGVHNIQGLSSGHVPDVLAIEELNQIVCIEDEEAIAMAKQLARTEGLAVGISSGATVHAAIQLAQQPSWKGKRIVVILADGAERYFSTDLFD